ncbi:hypothetical protein HID58_015587, partial [Brassica napus]
MLAGEMKSKTEGDHNLSSKGQGQIFSTSQRRLQNTGEGKTLTGENAKWMQEMIWKLGVDRDPAEIPFLEGTLARTLIEEEKITTVKLAVPPTIVTLIYTIVSLQASRLRDNSTSAREEPTPRQSRSNQNRGIPLEEIQASVPKEVFNAAVGEVRDAMRQYTQCNDPTESAARRERMRRAEEEGEMEETAALMIQAKMTAPTDTVESPEQQPSGERVPATLRLGPIAPPTQEPAPKVTKEAGKRKPGKPPGKRTVQGSPKLLRGSTSKKRKTQDKPTATRRKLNQDTAQGNPKKSKAKPSSSR